MSFDSLTLECFLAVTETGSFTRAAERVSRTQSAVSQQINKLESIIGKPVFYRGKNLSLTPEGSILLGYSKKIVKLNRDVLDRFKNPELQGEVRFGLPEDFASVFLSEVLAEYAALHPRIMLHIECDLTLNLFERFKNKDFDLVLLKMSKPEDFTNGIDVWSEKLEWVGNQYLFDMNNDDPVPLVLSPEPCVYHTRAINYLEDINKPWRIVFSSHSYAGRVAAVKAGMGLTVLPRNMIPEDLDIIKINSKKLSDTHISLLKHDNNDVTINSFEKFVAAKLKA
jgi:DNA-binding transcriptional LysR family regulator